MGLLRLCCGFWSGIDGSSVMQHNVVHKRVGHTSEWVKILYTLHSISHNINNIRNIETKQIAL